MSQPTVRAEHRVGSARVRAAASGRREARLRPEYADRYPGVPANEWISAAMLGDRVIARELLSGSPVGWRHRVLAPEHFEFRGGEQEGHRPRREDR
jgi:hypothetical protein